MEQADALEDPYFEDEVKSVIFGLDKDKSPRLDGFSMLFYQECWEILKKDLMEVFAKFHERSITSKGMNVHWPYP